MIQKFTENQILRGIFTRFYFFSNKSHLAVPENFVPHFFLKPRHGSVGRIFNFQSLFVNRLDRDEGDLLLFVRIDGVEGGADVGGVQRAWKIGDVIIAINLKRNLIFLKL